MRAAASAFLGLLAACASGDLLPRPVHLGVTGQPEWEEFARSFPHGTRLDLPFKAAPNGAEQTLFLRQENVKRAWRVELNGRALGPLIPQEMPTVCALAVPPGALVEGENRLTVLPPREADDVRLGPLRLDPRPVAEAVGEARLQVLVLEAPQGRAVPARVTIADASGALAPLLPASDDPMAVRPGVVYTGNGHARVAMPAGRYTVSAGRGFEYGIDRREIRVAKGETMQITLQIRREVLTPNLAACDTHVHTLEYSGHGDATAAERAVTIAGEGVELPVATEHNQNSSYAEAIARLQLRGRMTPIPGNEVTTAVGHFNIFPVVPGGSVADWKGKDWPAVLGGIRANPGVRVAILNHPRDKHSNFVPFGPANFNAATGAFRPGWEPAFDAVELINSGALRSDFMEVYRDWFALLNRGRRVFGVGSSDSHTVNTYIVGQGRTYVVCRDEDPGKIDLEEVYRSFREGRLLVSLGLLTQIKVNGVFGVGDLARGLGPEVHVAVSVHGPSWTQVDRVELYANGVKIREVRPSLNTLGGEKIRHTWTLPKPAHDVHLVAVASGPGVRDLSWPIPRPYQPSSPRWEPRVVGSTNPVWVDADGDGAFTDARGYASRLVQDHPDDGALLEALGAYDEAVAAQAAERLDLRGKDLRDNAFSGRLEASADAVRRGFAAYLAAKSAR
jgi:hypothetical protein